MSEELAAQLQSIFPDEADQLPIYLGDTHGAVLEALRQDLSAGRRFICLVGRAGSGKTKLLQALRAEFEQGLVGMATAPHDDAFLFSLMKGLGLQVPDRNQVAARQRLAVILGMAERKHTPVLQIVDAAERLGGADLDTLFQLFGPSFTQVVLSGRPELLDLLADGQRPLGVPRPDAVHRLDGLGATETGAYISHRLRQAQLPEDLFASDASAAMHARSDGVPRRINAISREALRRAEATGGDRVSQAEVQRTASAESPRSAPLKEPTLASDMHAASQPEPAKVASRTPELPSEASQPPATSPPRQASASGHAQGGASRSAESGPTRRSEPAPEAQRPAQASPQGGNAPPLVTPREPATVPAQVSKAGAPQGRPATDGAETSPAAAGSPPRARSAPPQVAQPPGLRGQAARDDEPPNREDARG
ncbi:MAG: AAA family ATPase, partial [Thiohalobacteraceae bacterium]